jgi:hypothetical protein
MSTLDKRLRCTAMPRRSAVTSAISAGILTASLVAVAPANAALVTCCIGTGGAVTVPNDL